MKRKSVVILGAKDRSKIRECMVTKKQGCGEEGETGEAGEGKQGKTWRWVSVGVGGRSREDPGEIHRSYGKDPEMGVCGSRRRSREDPGEIHRSMGFSVQECQRWRRQGWRGKGKGGARGRG